MQPTPVTHAVPVGQPVHAVCDEVGWQLWHGFIGFAPPDW